MKKAMKNNKYEIVIFKDEEFELNVKVSPQEDTVWLTQLQISQLFMVTKQNVSLHINNIFKENELNKNSVVKKYLTTSADGKKYQTYIYNLDVIISVGYRVKSKRGVLFRKWSSPVLKEYMLKGYVINENRTMVTNENYVNLINKVGSIDNRLVDVENKIINKEIPIEKIFYNGETYDVYSLIKEIFKSAKKENYNR